MGGIPDQGGDGDLRTEPGSVGGDSGDGGDLDERLERWLDGLQAETLHELMRIGLVSAARLEGEKPLREHLQA